MNDSAKLWIAGLKSNEFQQAKNARKIGDKYDVLGVACEIAIRNGIQLSIKQDGNLTLYDNRWDRLPSNVMLWLGLATASGHYKHTSLTDQNDAGASFRTLAKIIESGPGGMFA